MGPGEAPPSKSVGTTSEKRASGASADFPPALPRLQVSRSSQDLVNMLLLLIDYAQDERIEVPRAILDAAAADQNPSEPTQDWQRQSEALNKLAELIAPARPQTVAMLQQEKWKRQLARRPGLGNRFAQPWFALGPVPLIRFLALTALLFLAAFIALLAATSQADAATGADATSTVQRATLVAPIVAVAADAGSNFDNWGTAAALVAVAGLGATFEALFRAMQAVESKTYDPTDDGAYVLRVILGVVAGVLLVLVLPTDQDLNLTPYGVAIIGGFGAPVVYRILARLVEALESLVTAPPALDAADAARREAQLKLQKEQADLLPLVAQAESHAADAPRCNRYSTTSGRNSVGGRRRPTSREWHGATWLARRNSSRPLLEPHAFQVVVCLTCESPGLELNPRTFAKRVHVPSLGNHSSNPSDAHDDRRGGTMSHGTRLWGLWWVIAAATCLALSLLAYLSDWSVANWLAGFAVVAAIAFGGPPTSHALQGLAEEPRVFNGWGIVPPSSSRKGGSKTARDPALNPW